MDDNLAPISHLTVNVVFPLIREVMEPKWLTYKIIKGRQAAIQLARQRDVQDWWCSEVTDIGQGGRVAGLRAILCWADTVGCKLFNDHIGRYSPIRSYRYAVTM
jgi:hypothetical protein